MTMVQSVRGGMELRPDCRAVAGSGHLRRSLVLGASWSRHGGAELRLAVESGADPQLVAVASLAGVEQGVLSSPGWVVLDSYRAPVPEVDDLVILDDFRQRCDHGSKYVVDQNFGADRSLYPEADIALVGPSYALLRPEFATVRAQRELSRDRIEHVVVALGGVPPKELLELVTGMVCEALPGSHVEVLDGSRTDVGAVLARADLAVSAAGSTTWELLCCGVPTILLAVAPNQEAVRDCLVDAGYCWASSEADLRVVVRSVAADAAERHNRSIRGSALVDGLGAGRVVAELRSNDILLTRASMDDAATLFSWANDPVTRSNSFVSEPIDWATHVSWLSTILEDESSLLFVARYGLDLVGQVRFSLREEDVEIGVSLSPECRGRGLGAALILSGCRAATVAWGRRRIVARIKTINHASTQSFRSAGFAEPLRSGGDSMEMTYE